jgi:Tol biopolymer transport system component
MEPYDMIDRLIGVKFSPDSGKVAYVYKNTSEKSVRLTLNGKDSPSFDSIDEVLFSPDSKTIAYIVTKDKQQFVFRGDLQEGPFDKAEGLAWSPDSSQLAYIIIKNGEFRVVNNGREHYAGDFSPQTVFFEQGGYATRVQQITPPIFSPDASLMAFTKTENDKFRIVVGETGGPLFDRVSPVVFSPDSRHHAHIGVSQMLNEKKMQVVYNQNRSPFYDEIDLPVFSPDSTRLAYRVRVGDKWFMIIDGKKQKSYDAIGIPCFSPDSGTLAYQATEGNNVLMVTNGKEEPYQVRHPNAAPNMITRPCFSPDSRYLAYLVQTKPQECLLVINGDIIESFDAAYSQTIDMPLVFDSESKARFLAAFLKNDRYEAFRIDITIEPQQ